MEAIDIMSLVKCTEKNVRGGQIGTLDDSRTLNISKKKFLILTLYFVSIYNLITQSILLAILLCDS